MTNERFWEIIDKVDWPRENYDQIKVDLLMTLSPNEVEELRDELYRRISKVREAFNEARDKETWISDDGLSDLCNHVVGLGKQEYNWRLNNPDVLINDYKEGNFVESLSYALPYLQDYQKLGNAYYRHRSNSKAEDIREITENDRLAKSIQEKAKRLVSTMESFPDVKLRWFDCENESEFLDHLWKLAEDLDSEIKGWPIRNLISDYRTYAIHGSNDR